MYMPTTLHRLSVTKAQVHADAGSHHPVFPEVETVFGKAGRALTATDHVKRRCSKQSFSSRREVGNVAATITSYCAPRWTRPCSLPACRTPRRADPCAHRHARRREFGPSRMKVFGTSSTRWSAFARQVEAVLRAVPGTTSAYAERVIAAMMDIMLDRERLARYGLLDWRCRR